MSSKRKLGEFELDVSMQRETFSRQIAWGQSIQMPVSTVEVDRKTYKVTVRLTEGRNSRVARGDVRIAAPDWTGKLRVYKYEWKWDKEGIQLTGSNHFDLAPIMGKVREKVAELYGSFIAKDIVT